MISLEGIVMQSMTVTFAIDSGLGSVNVCLYPPKCHKVQSLAKFHDQRVSLLVAVPPRAIMSKTLM